MIRKIALIMLVVFAIPALASAWSISAKTGNTGGTISPAGITTISGTIGTSQAYTVTPAAGYAISRVTLNGGVMSAPYVVNYNALKTVQYIVAYFTPVTYTISSSVLTGGGTITGTATGLLYDSSKTFTITPNTGYSIIDVLVDGQTVGPVSNYTFNNITSNHTIAASFAIIPNVAADAGGDQTTTGYGEANGAKLDGSRSTANTGALSFKWTVSPSAPSAGAFTDSTIKDPVFYASVPGDYAITLTVTDPYGNSDADVVMVKVISTAEYQSNTCTYCHTDKNPEVVANYQKSSHMSSPYETVSCTSCHNPESRPIPMGLKIDDAFNAYTTASMTGSVGNVCTTCHVNGSPYGIFDENGIGKSPHFQAATPDANGYYPVTSYITAGGATCKNCHGHDNDVNAGWAESGHGDTSAVAFKSDPSHNWNNQGSDGVNYQSSPQRTNCIRCHSSRGFAQYWESGFSNINKIYLDPVAKTLDKASAPLTCDGCHTSSEGAVRQLPVGFAKVKTFYGYSNARYATKKVAVNLEFTNNKNSNICIPCHGQRASGTEIKQVYAAGTMRVYSSGTTMYPHEAQPAAIVDGKGGYEFASAQGYQDRMRHIRIGNYGTNPAGYNNTGITQGNCVGCHYNSEKTHSLESVTKDETGAITGIASSTCAKCHPAEFTYQNVQAKKDEFNAAVKALGNLLVSKGFTLDGVSVLAERKAFDMSRGTFDLAKAEKNTGAWFNWYLFNTADKAAYLHNPAYTRRLIYDAIDWLDDNTMNNSAGNTILAQSQGATPTLTAAEAQNAISFTNNPGCLGCHSGTSVNSTSAPGIERAPHMNTGTVPGQSFTAAQYVTLNAQCNYCHGYGHGTDSPGGTVLADYAESGHGEINGLAWTDYDFKTRATCNYCHTTTGYVKYVNSKFTDTAAWGNTGDTTKEVLACNACHSSTTWASSVRTFDSYSAPYGSGVTLNKVNYAAAKSNVCIICHSARENGQSLTAAFAGNPDNTNVSFKNPHYLGAAAILYGKGGFPYYADPVKYDSHKRNDGTAASFKHDDLGMNNYSSVTYVGTQRQVSYSANTGTDGPCVACHMNNSKSHTLSTVNLSLSMPASDGSNGTAVLPAGQGCYGCHRTEVISTVIEEEKELFNASLDLFKAVLAQNGMYYTPNHPYFMTQPTGGVAITNWTSLALAPNGPVGGSAMQNMGAAFNYKLLQAEPGAFTHNRRYSKRLIFDSIDYLQDGVVTGTVNFSAYSSATQPVSAIKGYLSGSSGTNDAAPRP